MIKIRLHGLPVEIEKFKNQLATDYELLNVSEQYPDRGDSKYSRIYIDLEQPDLYEDSKSFIKNLLKNKEKIKKVAENDTDAIFHSRELSKIVLIELLDRALALIEEMDAGEFDERDWKDVMFDKGFYFEKIIKSLQSDIESGVLNEEFYKSLENY